MPLFKKKVSAVVSESIEIPGWEQAPYDVLANEWMHSVGLSDPWEKCLKDAEPADVMACLQKVKVEKDKELDAAWIRSDKKAAKMLVTNQFLLTENEQLRMQSEQLSDRLNAAESHVCVRCDSSITDKADQCKSVMCVKPEKQVSRANLCAIKVGNASCRYKSTQPVIKRRIVRCFSCRHLGHIAKYCRFSGSETLKRDNKGKCFACGLVGHIARNCPGQKGRCVTMCYTCGKTGHISRNCYSTKSEARGLRPQQNDGPEMGGIEKGNSSSW